MPLYVDKLNVNGNSIGNYRVYTALLTQTGTDAPVATVLENTLGIEIIWQYNNPGNYTASTPNLYSDPSKVVFIINNSQNFGINGGENNVNEIYLNTYSLPGDGSLADNLLYNAFLEIRVYN
jgi:hypothetical protein